MTDKTKIAYKATCRIYFTLSVYPGARVVRVSSPKIAFEQDQGRGCCRAARFRTALLAIAHGPKCGLTETTSIMRLHSLCAWLDSQWTDGCLGSCSYRPRNSSSNANQMSMASQPRMGKPWKWAAAEYEESIGSKCPYLVNEHGTVHLNLLKARQLPPARRPSDAPLE